MPPQGDNNLSDTPLKEEDRQTLISVKASVTLVSLPGIQFTVDGNKLFNDIVGAWRQQQGQSTLVVPERELDIDSDPGIFEQKPKDVPQLALFGESFDVVVPDPSGEIRLFADFSFKDIERGINERAVPLVEYGKADPESFESAPAVPFGSANVTIIGVLTTLGTLKEQWALVRQRYADQLGVGEASEIVRLLGEAPTVVLALRGTHSSQSTRTWAIFPALDDLTRTIRAKKQKPPTLTVKHGTTRTQRFELDWDYDANAPIKLGDGSYASVFKIFKHNSKNRPDRGEAFALKVLYQRQLTTQTGLLRVLSSDIAELGGDPLNGDVKQINVTVEQMLEWILKKLDPVRANTIEAYREHYLAHRSRILDRVSATINQDNIPMRRLEFERTVTESVNRAVKDFFGEDRAASKYLVRVEDYVDDFHRSDAYKAMKSDLVGSGSDWQALSDYAIIYDYYDCTLKDLLERYDQIQKRVSALKARFTAEPGRGWGYTALRRLPYAERARAALPILIGVVDGLAALHMAGRTHGDIKPANVFFQIDENSFTVKLGDFSFAGDEVMNEGSREAVLRDFIGTGSMHFRSPEQRDFVEDYQATVSFLGGDVHRQLLVRVVDPKFDKDGIESGDYLVFSKDVSGQVHIINRVESEQGGDGGGRFAIFLDTPTENLLHGFQEGEITRVVIYRKPSVKTDWFGVGALAYDIVSAGESPELLYEVIRPLELSKSISVNDITASYRRGRGEGDPVVFRMCERLFDKVRNRQNPKDRLPEGFLRIILKCVGFNLLGAFGTMESEVTTYKDALRRGAGVREAWKEHPTRVLNEELKELEKSFQLVGRDRVENCAILTGVGGKDLKQMEMRRPPGMGGQRLRDFFRRNAGLSNS